MVAFLLFPLKKNVSELVGFHPVSGNSLGIKNFRYIQIYVIALKKGGPKTFQSMLRWWCPCTQI